MILYDFSSLMHRAVFSAVKSVNPHKKDKKYVTDEFIGLAIHRILSEILDTQTQYSKKYKDIVICFDDHSRKYWRKELYPDYKAQRKVVREESEIDYESVFKHLDVLSKVIDDYTPWRSFSVQGAEADDLIAVLTRKFAPFEPVLIHSPDKDMIQLHRYGEVVQWSGLTNKFVTHDDKGPDWEMEHVALGDASDNVPKITDNSVFSENFKQYLDSKNIKMTEYEFNKLSDKSFMSDYDVLNKKGHLDVFNNPRFGSATLHKEIKRHGSLDAFLDSNPIYRLNYERNKILVLESGIPAKIEANILVRFNQSKTDFEFDKLERYLKHYNLNTLINDFRVLYDANSKIVELTVENCGF